MVAKPEVIVVGAGPAGSTAAKVLAENGVSVLLVDKHSFPRDKPCGGGLPARVLRRFPYVGKKGLVESYSSRMCVYSSSLRSQTNLEHSAPMLAMIRRVPFDVALVGLAADSGAELRTGVAVTRLTVSGHRAQVTLSDGSFLPAPYVIVATGMGSRILRDLGYPLSRRHIGACVMEEYPVPRSVMDQVYGEERCVHVCFGVLGIAGYGWVFPKAEHVNVGVSEFYHALGGHPKKNLRQLYSQFIDLLKSRGLVPEMVSVLSPKGGVFPTLPQRRTYGSCFLLCGDAGGLANPLTGEGIYEAMSSGEHAAKAIVRAMKTRDSSPTALSVYQRWWMEDFGDDNRRYYRASRFWRVPTERLWRIVERDPVLKAHGIALLMGSVRVRDVGWSVARHTLTGYVRDRLGRF